MIMFFAFVSTIKLVFLLWLVVTKRVYVQILATTLNYLKKWIVVSASSMSQIILLQVLNELSCRLDVIHTAERGRIEHLWTLIKEINVIYVTHIQLGNTTTWNWGHLFERYHLVNKAQNACHSLHVILVYKISFFGFHIQYILLWYKDLIYIILSWMFSRF